MVQGVNIVGKRENAGYQHFHLFVMFSKLTFSGLLKAGLFGKKT